MARDILLILLVVAVATGLLISPIFFVNKFAASYQSSKISSTVFLTPTPKITTSSSSGVAPWIDLLEDRDPPGEIYIRPVDATRFTRLVTTGDGCGEIWGLTSYRDEKTKSSMYIHSLLFPEVTNHIGAKHIINIVDNGVAISQEMIGGIEGVFHMYCGGHYVYFMKELPFTYPGMDASRVYIAQTGQDVFGNVTIYVVAKKGDNIVRLSRYLMDGSPLDAKYEAYGAKCFNNVDGENSEGLAECYRQLLFTDPYVLDVANAQARELIGMFRIE